MSVHAVVDGKQTQGYTGFASGFSLSFKHVRNLLTHHGYFCFIRCLGTGLWMVNKHRVWLSGVTR